MLDKIPSHTCITEQELCDLRKLKDSFDYAREICDPIDFPVRQKKLLYALAQYLLAPLDKYENEIRHEEI